MIDFKDCYFETNSAEETKALLKYLDKYEFKWANGKSAGSWDSKYINDDKGVFLFVEENVLIYEPKGSLRAIDLTQSLNKMVVTFKSSLVVESAEVIEIVEFNGKKYNKSDLEEALKLIKLIKPVE